MSVGTRIWLGGCVGVILGCVLITFASAALMEWAEGVTGDRFAWPQIAFMSAYPDDVRNGYLMFAASVLGYVALSSGVFAAIFGASPGKALFGLHYVSHDRTPAKFRQIFTRAGIILGVMAFVLLAGPLLGFVFGPTADILSLIALALGIGIAYGALCRPGKDGLSWANRRAALRPALRNHPKEA